MRQVSLNNKEIYVHEQKQKQNCRIQDVEISSLENQRSNKKQQIKNCTNKRGTGNRTNTRAS